MKVFVKGKGEVTLTQANFVAQGGQASVYQKNGTAYKVYSDPKDTIPEAKFNELSRIQDSHVVKPKELLVGANGSAAPIGYTMDFLKDTFVLCQLFPKAFRDRNAITHDMMRKLVGDLQQHIENVHRAGALVVDLNELNILASATFDQTYLIDVDSYQTAHFKAEVIMPSVRDWSVKPAQFSELSDWFSFAVLACQMFVGIHPYRGTHHASANVPADQRLEHRMRQHVSIFDRSVGVPKACFSTDVIPPHQRAWLMAVLQEGRRLPPPPPDGLAPFVVATVAAASGTAFGGNLTVTLVGTFEGTVLGYQESGGDTLVHTDQGVFLNGHRVHGAVTGGTLLIGFTPKMNRPIGLHFHNGSLSLLEFAERRSTAVAINADELSRSGDRFYIRNVGQVFELALYDMPDRVMVTAAHPVANVMESASRLFDGCAIQSMIGSVFVSLFPTTRAGYQCRIAELDSYRIVDAKFEGGVLMVVGAKGGIYDRLIFRFDASFATYDLRAIPNISPAGLNFTVFGKLCVSLTEEEEIEAFPVTMGATGLKVAGDAALGADMRLMLVGGRVGFSRGPKVFTLSMK